VLSNLRQLGSCEAAQPTLRQHFERPCGDNLPCGFWNMMAMIRWKRWSMGNRDGKKISKLRPWTKEDIRTLKTLAREKVKTTVIARKLKRTVGATHQKAMRLGVALGGGRSKRA
jgi:hypothetical protein